MMSKYPFHFLIDIIIINLILCINMSSADLKEEIMKLISLELLDKSYLSLSELEKFISTDEIDLTELLEELHSRYELIGITLEIIEFNDEQFVIVTLNQKNKAETFSKSVYSILTILAHLATLKENNVALNEITYLLKNYMEELDILVQNKLILFVVNDHNQEYIQITPLGANLISPVVSKFQDLLPYN
ncbi:MAG: hypothetical protein HeimC3_17770 [Candidatus Heimdallarchaeota archaeon LC_3]|nr:MAG: hypothetical protein HeimC3_17770 [Candidatus Heimdallarchaeota archaeon LC_3]